jgi:iron complex transport system permease protein
VKPKPSSILKRLSVISLSLLLVLLIAMFLGISMGSTTSGIKVVFQSLLKARESDPMLDTIIWQIRFPRVLLAALVGAALSLGGLVFQALLRNPLAEPYILGISGGSAIGAIIGILIGFSKFPGVSLTAFAGSIAILLLILVMSSGQTILKKDALLLSGVMVNAFCAAVIMFLVSMTQDSRLHNIIFWLMGDLSMVDRPCGNPCRNSLPLFYPDFLVFQFHESAAHGQGNGANPGSEYKGGNGYSAGNDVI